ncbi:MAG: hypothetical protein H6736_06215 [Alphaproteobacteria bacterium]|nr:hypothetical protein [Alphaproteobacteria bacterium]
MPVPTGVGLWLFLAVVAACLAWLVAAVVHTAPAARRARDGGLAVVAVVVWLGVASLPVGLGLADPAHPVPVVPIMMGTIFAVAFGTAASPLGARLARLPLAVLVGFQAMRFPLEIVLHLWAEEGVAPPQMTWTGENVDIVAGITCLVLAPIADRSRAAAWASQAVGIALLANVLRVVGGSVLGRYPDPLLIPFQLPAFWIAPVCVCGALMVHAITLRRLLGS